ncbi:hypothetical protein ACI65C_004216 [Semiaphis heraclei]
MNLRTFLTKQLVEYKYFVIYLELNSEVNPIFLEQIEKTSVLRKNEGYQWRAPLVLVLQPIVILDFTQIIKYNN